MISAHIRRTLIAGIAIVAFLVLAGATYQGAATALERRRFPHPGALVGVGGHQLHIYCVGQGSPVVVLEAPAAGMSTAWGWIQPEVGSVTRVCSYDRAGLGWSEAGDNPYSSSDVPEQLHALLDAAKEAPPYVVVGDGLGAALVTLYAARFGGDVATVVLIDPPAADSPPRQLTSMMRLANVSPWLARTGVLRATRLMSSNAAGLPEPARGALGAFLNRPDHLARAARELAQWDDAIALAAHATIDPRIPVVRIQVARPGGAAFLTERDEAHKAAAAIINALARLRGNQ